MTISKSYIEIAKKYADNSDDYVYEYTTKVNGKERKIVTYKGNTAGCSLRHLHTYIDHYLKSRYESNSNSFAYKKGCSIHSCLERHLSSNMFLKIDVKSFFDTVDPDILLGYILKLPRTKTDSKMLKTVIESCFYGGRMPIGFITSPVLSDIYLNNLDRAVSGIKNVVYTRYADDIIVSASVQNARDILKETKSAIEKMLGESGLELNKKKTYIRELLIPGDAIHLLGLNMVKTDQKQNRITVSDRFIRETCKEFCEYIEKTDYPEIETRRSAFMRVYGKIQFIADSSSDSCKKLQKMLKVKTGMDFDLSYHALMDI